MYTLYKSNVYKYRLGLLVLRPNQQILILLLFSLFFIHLALAETCQDGKSALKDWALQKKEMDIIIPRNSVKFDKAQGVYHVTRESADQNNSFTFSIYGNKNTLINIDIPWFQRAKGSRFSGNAALYSERYSGTQRFGLMKDSLGRIVLPETFTYKIVDNKATMAINYQLGVDYDLPASYTLEPGEDAFDQYIETSGTLARSTQRVIDKANSYLKPEESKWTITKIEVEGKRNGTGNSSHSYEERYDDVDKFIVTVAK